MWCIAHNDHLSADTMQLTDRRQPPEPITTKSQRRQVRYGRNMIKAVTGISTLICGPGIARAFSFSGDRITFYDFQFDIKRIAEIFISNANQLITAAPN